MNKSTFIQEQITQIRQGGYKVLVRKMKTVLRITIIRFLAKILAVPAVLLIRLIRPWLLVRWHGLFSTRIGHLAANTELYLCERDAEINKPNQRYIDIFYFRYRPICNNQLATMWRRHLNIWPEWILSQIDHLNRLSPGGVVHEIGNNTQQDRDVHHLLDRFPPHLKFTDEEEARGEAGLRTMGIPPDTPFVCLIVRDSAYLNIEQPGDSSYHNYRDCDIQNYILAAEELAERGYFVIRMSVHVQKEMKSKHPRVIDYASNGMRNDFMDIYLGAKCTFCISSGLGWDAIPEIFRRPIVYTNLVPFGYIITFRKIFLSLTKHHFIVKENRKLTVSEIFNLGVGFCLSTSDYESKGIQLIENTPEEIRDIVIEMEERLNDTWHPHKDDEDLQKRFWEIFPTDAVDAFLGQPLHGKILARFGAQFLRNNREWLK